MDFIISDHLKNRAADFGDEGIQWLNDLPGQAARLTREWNVTIGPALDHSGQMSWIAPATLADGSPAILKMGIPHDEARYESDALRFWDGQGAVRLLNVSDDGHSLLLERCIPGTDLWSLPLDDADTMAATILPRLWREPPQDAPFDTLADVVAVWREEVPTIAAADGHDPAIVAQALDLGSRLVATQTRRVLLHGDFHPANALAAEREPYLVIDPKPIVGEPAYDLAQWLANRYDAALPASGQVSALRGQIARFAERLDLSPARIAGWAFVKSVGWEWSPPFVAAFREVAGAWPDTKAHMD